MGLGLSILAGYVAGSLPWALWLGRWLRGVDVRSMGSGNLGATNVYRSLGPGIGVAVIVLDILKGALPVWLVPGAGFATDFPGGPAWCAVGVGLAAIAGHMWTFLANFRGGKGVATTVGVLLALDPLAFGVFVGVFLLVLLTTRYVSLGSILGAIAFAITLGVAGKEGVRSPAFAFAVLVAILIIVRHRPNIGRLLGGTENRFAFRSKAQPSGQRGGEARR